MEQENGKTGGIADRVLSMKFEKVEEALKESHKTLLTVLDSIDATLYVADMTTHEILFANRFIKECFGRDIVGDICWRVFRGRDAPCQDCTSDKLLDKEGNATGVCTWEGRNPITGRWYINYDRAVKWIDGRMVRLQVGTDITRLKEAEEQRRSLEKQLLQAQKMEAIGAMAAGIAHDFNNLLMGLQGNASLMLADLNENHPHHERLTSIEAYVRKGAELTRQLLGFARGGEYKVEPVDLNDLVKKSAALFIRTKKEITLHAKYPGDLWPAMAHQGQIEQALLNLYINAWQSMPSGGTLTVSTENFMMSEEMGRAFDVAPGKYIKLSIADTGAGMDQATRERIFEPFFTTKKMGRGSGLGLASVYGIIKNHGGAIEVESRVGEGTTFRIYLPASSSKTLKKEKTLQEVLIKSSGTILLVDDEEMITQVGGEILEKLGYTVLSAGSGKEAVDLFRRRPDSIDLIILDMVMPDMNGPEVFDRLREIDPGVKVLLSSGYTVEGAARGLLRKGCLGFIQKPYSISDLSDRVRAVMKKESGP